MILIDIFSLLAETDIFHYLFYCFIFCGVTLLTQYIMFGRARL